MKLLYPILIYTIILTFFSELHSVKVRSNGMVTYLKKDVLFYSILAVGMAVFVGLRTSYNDTFSYVHAYELMSDTFDLNGVSFLLGSNPGFKLVTMFLRSRHVSSQNFLMIFALLTNLLYLWFIRKYSTSLLASVLLFIVVGDYLFTMAAIKQTVAIAFCLVATDRAFRKKRVSFVFWILIATMFHPYALMYLIVPFLSFKPWSSKTVVILLLTITIGFSLQLLLGTIVSITSMLGEEYTESSFSGGGINVFRLLVVWTPVVLSFFVKDKIHSQNDKIMNTILNLTMIQAAIMFIALFGTANYFGRLANYFAVFQALTLPYVIKQFDARSRSLLTIAAIIGYSLYFYYANAVNNGGFDYHFSRITLSQYLTDLFQSAG